MEPAELLETLETFSIIQKLEDLLLVSVPRDLMDDQITYLRREVLRRARQHHSHLVLLDFSQVDICDSYFGRFIQSMAKMAGLVGAEVIVSGLQDAVVETLVDLGMLLTNIRCVLDLDDALALSRESRQIGGLDEHELDEETSSSPNMAEHSDPSFADWSLADSREA